MCNCVFLDVRIYEKFINKINFFLFCKIRKTLSFPCPQFLPKPFSRVEKQTAFLVGGQDTSEELLPEDNC